MQYGGGREPNYLAEKSPPFVGCMQAERTRLRDAEAPPQRPSEAKEGRECLY